MSTLKFYLDTHIDKQVAIQLRSHNITVIRCQDVELEDADDETHLTYAAEHQLILVTKDNGFRDRHYLWISEGKHHAGIFFYPKRHIAGIGEIVSFCKDYADLVADGAGDTGDFADAYFDIQ
jgi:hypothetical protein